MRFPDLYGGITKNPGIFDGRGPLMAELVRGRPPKQLPVADGTPSLLAWVVPKTKSGADDASQTELEEGSCAAHPQTAERGCGSVGPTRPWPAEHPS